MKNQVKNKNRNNTFDSNEFIHFIADLIGSLYIFHFLSSVSGLRNVIYFFIIAIPKKSHSAIFEIQIFVQNAKKRTWIPFLFLRYHACGVKEWCFVDCFHQEFRASTQMMLRNCCSVKNNVFRVRWTFNGFSGQNFHDLKYLH